MVEMKEQLKVNDKEISHDAKKKLRDMEVSSLKKDIDNKKREVADNKINLEAFKKMVKLAQREKVAVEELGELFVKNQGKVESQIVHKYETLPRYWELNAEIQRIDNEKKKMNLDEQERKLTRAVTNAEDQIKSLSEAIREQELRLKELERKQI